MTERVTGWWSGDAELDGVAVDEETETVRVITCKRAAAKLLPSLPAYERHAALLMRQGRFRGWRLEKIAVAPQLTQRDRHVIAQSGHVAYDLSDLLWPLRETTNREVAPRSDPLRQEDMDS